MHDAVTGRAIKVLIAGTSFLSAYGGPAYSVSCLAAALADAGAEVGLWAADNSADDAPVPPSRRPVRRFGGSEARALEESGADILHDNGLWLPYHRRLAKLAAARAIPRVVSTRGMLEPWAIRHKALRKRIAWPLYQRAVLKSAACLHATAEPERQTLEKLGLGVPVRMIPNAVPLPKLGDEKPKNETGKTALFLGRIYPVKGLPMLVEAWARVRPEGWRLVIAGPDEAGHRAEVERAVAGAGLNDTVSFAGPLDGDAKDKALRAADLLVLPSHTESFGMAAAEALSYGVPVLTTRGTPWSSLPERNCGWWVEATPEGLAQGLREGTACDDATLQAMGARGRAFVAAEFGWERIAAQFLATYEGILSGKISKGPA